MNEIKERRVFCFGFGCGNIIDLNNYKDKIEGGVKCPKCGYITPLFSSMPIPPKEE